MDVAAFVRDGYVAIRGAFGPETASACRDAIWDVLAERGVSRDDWRAWDRPLVSVPCPEGEPFAVAGTSPALLAAYDELIGPGRWVAGAGVGGTVPVRFPSEEYPGDAGYHIEGNWWGGDEYWTNAFLSWARAAGAVPVL